MSSRVTGTLALLASVAVWGTTYVLAKGILDHIGPFSLAVARFAISLAILVPIATKLGRQPLPRFGRSSLILGLFGVALYFGLQNLGLTMTSAASAALVAAVIPALTAALGYFVLGERLTRLQVVGVALAVTGVALVVGADLDLGSPERVIGSLLVFGAAASWAVYTIQGRRVLHGISPAVVSVQTTAVGLAILLPFAAWEIVRDGPPSGLETTDIAGILYLGIVASAITFILWNAGLRAMGSTTSTVMLNLIPVVGLATSFVAGESISPLQLIGGAVVLGGVMFTLQSGRRAPRPVEAPKPVESNAGEAAVEAPAGAGAGATLDLPDAPPIPGLRFRRYAGPADLPAMADLLNRAYDADGQLERMSPEVLGNELTFGGAHDPVPHTILAEIDGRLVAWGRTWVEPKADGSRSCTLRCWMAPEARGRGIGRAMLRANERHLRDDAAAEDALLPAGTEPPWRELAVYLGEDERGHRALVESEGFRPVRWFLLMLRPSLDDLPSSEAIAAATEGRASRPEGLEIRQVTPETARNVIDATEIAFRDHWGHSEWTDEVITEMLGDPRRDYRLWLAAWDGDQVAGAAMASILVDENEAFGWKRGWVEKAGVLRPYRKRGLATHLIIRLLALLREQGMTSAFLDVDAESPTGALGLYESLGFRVERRGILYSKPFEAPPSTVDPAEPAEAIY